MFLAEQPKTETTQKKIAIAIYKNKLEQIVHWAKKKEYMEKVITVSYPNSESDHCNCQNFHLLLENYNAIKAKPNSFLVIKEHLALFSFKLNATYLKFNYQNYPFFFFSFFFLKHTFSSYLERDSAVTTSTQLRKNMQAS